uniref:Monocyte to macrophage differentiation associated 2 n=1 Tax=Monodelphis domestica TaxID=13616 RepID=F7F802_MONDO
MFVSRFLDFQKTKYARFMNHRVPANKRYQPTEYEHAANCATHAFWIIPSILGSSNLYFLSDDDWETISAWIYGFGLCGLFVVSTVFHTISWKKRHLRMVEHCLHMFDRMVIYFFIAASYAPWLNLRELGPWAAHMRWIVWIMASIGTIYVFFFHERYKLVELLCYVVMGFFPALVILSMPNTDGILELMTGGVFYCFGMVFFKSDGRIPFAHAIWHLFVAFGAGTHYYAIWREKLSLDGCQINQSPPFCNLDAQTALLQNQLTSLWFRDGKVTLSGSRLCPVQAPPQEWTLFFPFPLPPPLLKSAFQTRGSLGCVLTWLFLP